MSIESAFYTIEFYIALALLVAFLYGPWQKFVESLVRHKLFKIRDELFDYAAEGNIDFDSEDYGRVRESLNSFIRFAHTMSWIHVFLSRKLVSEQEKDVRSLFEFSDDLSDDVKAFLKMSSEQGFSCLLVLIVLRSPLLLGLIVVTLPIALVLELVNNKSYVGKIERSVGKAVYSDIYCTQS